jgi:hypothetical protein
MGRNLYIVAGTLGFLALVCYGLSFSAVAVSSGDRAMWRMMAIGGFVIALVVALGGNMSTLFAQAERRADEERLQRRRARRQE